MLHVYVVEHVYVVVASDPTQGLVNVGGGEKGERGPTKVGGNLYSGQSMSGGNGGKFWLGELGNVGARSFLLA